MTSPFFLENLEDRIAPVGLFGSNIAYYAEPDGDLVAIKFSKHIFAGNDAGSENGVFALNPDTNGIYLDLSQLNHPENAIGTSITFAVKKGPSGNGFADIEKIIAPYSLGAVKGIGNLGAIDVLNTKGAKLALKSLSVDSMRGLTGQLDFESNFEGAVGSITIKHDLDGTDLFSDFGIQSIKIGGSINATNGFAGLMFDSAKTITVGGNLIGGDDEFSGSILINAAGSITVSGSLQGGAGDFTAAILADTAKSITVGSIAKGQLSNSGGIFIGDSDFLRLDTTIKVTGSITTAANPDPNAFAIVSADNIKSLTIGGNVEGALFYAKNFGDIKITGDVLGGHLTTESTAFIANTIKSFSAHSISGSATNPIKLVATDPDSTGYNANGISIGTIKIAGNVTGAQILAGIDTPSAKVTSIAIGGDLNSSTISVGVDPGDDNYFGTIDDWGNGLSSLGSLTVKGVIHGSGLTNTNYGILAGSIGKATIGGQNLAPFLSQIGINSPTRISFSEDGGYITGGVYLALVR